MSWYAPVLSATAAAMFAAGCTNVLDTSHLYAETPDACRISTGAYYMPKRLLRLRVTSDKTDGTGRYDVEVSSETVVPDVNFLFCLDYLSNPFSEDHVGIDRTPSGLLKRVYTRAIDKTDEIAIKLIEALGDGAAAGMAGRSLRRKFREGEKDIVSEFTFDPFDLATVQTVNDSLHDLGFCVYLDPRNDPYVPPWSGEQCDVRNEYASGWNAVVQPAAYHGGQSGGLKDLDFREIPVPVEAREGILYRPNLTHSLVVLRREDPEGPEPWAIYKKQRLELPNAAPIFSVRVQRSLFVERRTDLIFDNGVLVDVAIKKDSELAAFVDIPLVAAQVVVRIPTQVLKIRLNTAQNEKAIIEANAKLFDTICTIEKNCPGTASAGQAVAAADAAAERKLARNADAAQAPVGGRAAAVDSYVETKITDACSTKANDEPSKRDLCVSTAMRCLEKGSFEVTQCINSGQNAIENLSN